QKVMLQLSMRPTSPAALSFTRRFQVPFKALAGACGGQETDRGTRVCRAIRNDRAATMGNPPKLDALDTSDLSIAQEMYESEFIVFECYR
ncbi:MAG: hypothetical protein WAZ48_00050, partial [Lysobacteraceae bacterium]